MSKPTKEKPGKKESRKEAISRIAAENRTYFEKLDAKARNNTVQSESPTVEISLPPQNRRQESRDMPSPDSTLYVCPHCKKECTIANDLIGGDVSCPYCSNVFNATAHTLPPHSVQPAQQTAPSGNPKRPIGEVFGIIFLLTVVATIIVCAVIAGRALISIESGPRDSTQADAGPQQRSIAKKPPQSESSWHRFVPASLKQVEVTGTLYVKLNSGESVSLSMVKVAAYEEGLISNKMARINDYIEKERVNLSAKTKTYIQRKGEIEEGVSGNTVSPAYNAFVKDPVEVLENAVKLKVILDLKILSLVNDEPIWGEAVATSVTDKDGKFKITLPDTGHYVLFAVASRRPLGGIERYIFYNRFCPESILNNYTLDLNNNAECVSVYTQSWSRETINETSDLELLKTIMYWIMRQKYGLEDIKRAR